METSNAARVDQVRTGSLARSHSVARTMMFKLLDGIKEGCLRIHEHDGFIQFGKAVHKSSLTADIYIHDVRFYADIIARGSVGAGEAYMKGFWSTTDLAVVIRLFVRNMSCMDAIDGSQAYVNKKLLQAYHWLKRNTLNGARQNISAHYDLGNNFFKLFLDESMMYSAAIYPQPDATLAEAASYKLRRVCEKLQLEANDHLLEIGTGWGGMAIYAAQHYGCRVTTTTISREQHDFAQARVNAAGLTDKITVLFDDYRDLRGQFTKLVSIEMIEAVGHDYYATYFATCSDLLAPDGLMLLQAITIADQRYEQSRHSVDFIQRYIFPGGALPSIAVIGDWVKRKTDMNIIHVDDIGVHYAQTLRHWRHAFLENLAQVREQGFDEHFIRMWEFYLCYCEGGFMERSISTAQVLLAKPRYRPGYFLAATKN